MSLMQGNRLLIVVVTVSRHWLSLRKNKQKNKQTLCLLREAVREAVVECLQRLQWWRPIQSTLLLPDTPSSTLTPQAPPWHPGAKRHHLLPLSTGNELVQSFPKIQGLYFDGSWNSIFLSTTHLENVDPTDGSLFSDGIIFRDNDDIRFSRPLRLPAWVRHSTDRLQYDVLSQSWVNTLRKSRTAAEVVAGVDCDENLFDAMT